MFECGAAHLAIDLDHVAVLRKERERCTASQLAGDDDLEGPIKMSGSQRGFAAVIALAGLLFSPGASASQVCQGNYVTAALLPLPKQITVEVAVHTPTPRNLELANEFLGGVRKTGLAVSGPATIQLHISTLLLSSTSDQPLGSRRDYGTDFSGTQGGIKLRLPDMPSAGITSPPSPSLPPIWSLHVQATIKSTGQTAWFASVRCRMIGPNEKQLAQDLGQMVGRTLGKTTQRQPF